MHLTSKASSTPSSTLSSPSLSPSYTPTSLANSGFRTGTSPALQCFFTTRVISLIPKVSTFPSQAGDIITLEFTQVLQATAASPAWAARIRPGGSAQEAGFGRMRSERIVEEEDGWDVVELGGEVGFG
ncbi:hypothetical protein BDR03DRAFT_949750 [Suillus americanus]|nr:hypothetical protein BDR03DRAFT_949750 [Suillus americanus]